jgi:hypothetical protein
MVRLAPRGAATAPHRTPTFGSAAALHRTRSTLEASTRPDLASLSHIIDIVLRDDLET